jgi:antitoxin component YwqK of YwqJK toxin-antitoxin module
MKEKKRKRYFGNNISIESDGDEDLKSVKKDNLYNGILNGRGKEYYNLNKDDKNNNNKDLIYEGEFYNGMFNGEGKLYFENGNIIFEGKFLNDEPFEGTIKIYDETGKIIGENKLKYGKSNGPIWLKTCYEEFEGEDIDDKHWNGKYKVFNQKDEIKINGEIKNGSFNGIAKIENKEGELIEVEYKNGKIWTGNTEDFKKDIFF